LRNLSGGKGGEKELNLSRKKKKILNDINISHVIRKEGEKRSKTSQESKPGEEEVENYLAHTKE